MPIPSVVDLQHRLEEPVAEGAGEMMSASGSGRPAERKPIRYTIIAPSTQPALCGESDGRGVVLNCREMSVGGSAWRGERSKPWEAASLYLVRQAATSSSSFNARRELRSPVSYTHLRAH